jgi:hypothetical protein
METIGHAVAVEPGTGLLHGVAILDTVDGKIHFPNASLPRGYL